MKINFGDGGPQKFLLHHAEKIVFVGICAFVLWFIYSGTGAKSLDSDLTPVALKNKANETSTAIMSSKWEVVQDQRKERVDISKEVDSRTIVIEPSPYVARDNWNPPLVPRLTPRTDPKLFAPEKLKVVPLVGALATIAEKDPLAVFASGAAVGGKKEVPAKKTPTPKDKEKEKNKRPPRPGDVGGPVPGYPGPGPGAEFGGMMPGMPGGANGMLNMGKDFEKTLGISAAGTVPVAANAVVINAVVPYAQQWRAYQTAFSRAPGGMKAGRDMPFYLDVRVERADVTADPTADAATIKWEALSTAQLDAKEEQYGVDVPEICDPQYIDDKITRLAPPFLVTDLREALTHADVPLAKLEEELVGVDAPKEADPMAVDPLEGEDPDAPRSEKREGMGAGGDSRIPGVRSKRTPRVRGIPGVSGNPYGPGGPRPGGVGSNPYGTEAIDPATFAPVEKKLVRFVDFEVKPGRVYRYRMQVVLEDPNRPENLDLAPDITSLDSNAKERIKKLEAAELKAGRKTHIYYRKSDWSEASEPVSLPRLDRFLAGNAEPAATLKIAGVPVTTKEPEVAVLSVVWDPRLAILAPMEFKLARGGMFNATRDIEQVHPANGTLLKIPDYRMTTNGMLIDMKGGMPFPSAERDRTRAETAPGEAVIVDARGRIIVTIEAESVIEHHKHAPHKEEKKPEPKGPGGAADFSEFMEGELPGYPSPQNTKKSGKAPRE